MSPRQFYDLKNTKDKLVILTNLYIKCCTEEANFYKVKNHFAKDNSLTIQVIYEYLYSLGDIKKIMDIKTLYENAKKYIDEQNYKKEQEKQSKLEVKEYTDYCLEDLL